MRMSSGPSAANEKPRVGASSCGELTPRSATNPSTARGAERAQDGAQLRVVAVHHLRARAVAGERAARRGDGVGVAIDRDDTAVGRARVEDRAAVPTAARRWRPRRARRVRAQRRRPSRPPSPTRARSRPSDAQAPPVASSPRGAARDRRGTRCARPRSAPCPRARCGGRAGPHRLALQAGVLAQRRGIEQTAELVELDRRPPRQIEEAQCDSTIFVELRLPATSCSSSFSHSGTVYATRNGSNAVGDEQRGCPRSRRALPENATAGTCGPYHRSCAQTVRETHALRPSQA